MDVIAEVLIISLSAAFISSLIATLFVHVWSRSVIQEKELEITALKLKADTLAKQIESEQKRCELIRCDAESRVLTVMDYFTTPDRELPMDFSPAVKLMETESELFRNLATLMALLRPLFLEELRSKDLSIPECGYCCALVFGFSPKERKFYALNSVIRSKIGLDPHSTNLSIYLKDLFQRCG